jgi:acetyltransferase-like isoleucine patch superfamily enzyme
MDIVGNILKALNNPMAAWSYLTTRGMGMYYRCKYLLTGKNVKIGKNFRVEGKLIISGPGKVVFGDNVTIGMSVTPLTLAENAVITIGNNVYLNGTRFTCGNNITIKDNCIIAQCRIMDIDQHGVHPNYRHVIMTAPVTIQENVWVTVDCIILKGVEIGAGSTITPNSVISSNVPENCIFGGNPAAYVKKVL